MYIHVLSLESQKFYIGKSVGSDTDEIIKSYTKTKNIEPWVKKYKPLTVVEIFKQTHDKNEHYITIYYMKKYGMDAVRSGLYPDIQLDKQVMHNLAPEIKTFEFIDKYQSYNYVPFFVQTVESNLYKFFNSPAYTASENKYQLINEELFRLHELYKNIKELDNVISLTNRMSYYSDNTYTSTTIELIDIVNNKDLMDVLYFYDDNNIQTKSSVDSDYLSKYAIKMNIFDGLERIGDRLGFAFKKRSLLLMNLIDFNITKKKQLYELTKHDMNLSNMDIINYTVIGLTEEKLKQLLNGYNNMPTLNEPPAYEQIEKSNAYTCPTAQKNPQ